ncbi:hypothetical protein [Comamonas odontotermitis]|uniref:hypothetical protein n=1 Tax=Comamonas TaxID=283 RepID=UPI0037523563
MGDKVTRGMGLGVRSLAQGLASVPGMVTDNLIAKPLNAAADAVMGEGNGPRLQPLKQAVGNLATHAGLPQPETASERVAQDIVEGGAGAATGIGAGAALARGAGAVAQGVGGMLMEAPMLQTASGAASGAASGITRENGGGEGAQLVAALAGGMAPLAVGRKQVVLPEKAQVAAAAQQAREAGYVLPPADLSPGKTAELMSAFSGKIKTAQEASSRNQNVSNALAKRALGLEPEVNINLDTLEGLRRTAAQAYEPVATSGTVVPTDRYRLDLQKALAPFRSQAASFPNAKVPGVVADIQALNARQFDAGDALNMVRYMREAADRSYRAGENMAGKAYKMGAGALEDALEKHLSSLGESGADILKNFRDARQTIAKTYSVQGALNPQTGAVNAIKLARDLAQNKPLTGELRTIAEAGQAFPKAMQALKEAPKELSVLDITAALGAGVAGHPLAAAGVLSRPLARNALLSDLVQERAVRTAGTQKMINSDAVPAIALNAATQSAQSEQPVYSRRLDAEMAGLRQRKKVVQVPGGWAVDQR